MATAVGIDLGTTNSVIATVVRFRVRDKLYAPEEISALVLRKLADGRREATTT